MSQGTANKLHYADAEHAPGKPWGRRLVLALLVLGAVAVLAAWLPETVRNVKLMRLQSKCLEYNLSPTTIVFDSRSTSLPTLPRSDPELKATTLDTRAALGKVAGIWADLWRAVEHSTFDKWLATVFLHRVYTASGNERLVAVSLVKNLGGDDRLEFHSVVYELGGLRTRPRGKSYKVWKLLDLEGQPDVTVFAGQPDPKRSDHFTIEAIIAGRPYVIEGFLPDDDSITFELVPKSPPTPSPPLSPASSP